MKKKKIRKVILIIFIGLFLWLTMGSIDYFRVKSFEKPLFTFNRVTEDDGGTGTYKGLDYSFEIKGNFMPEDELPGVTYYKYFIFNHFITEGIRD